MLEHEIVKYFKWCLNNDLNIFQVKSALKCHWLHLNTCVEWRFKALLIWNWFDHAIVLSNLVIIAIITLHFCCTEIHLNLQNHLSNKPKRKQNLNVFHTFVKNLITPTCAFLCDGLFDQFFNKLGINILGNPRVRGENICATASETLSASCSRRDIINFSDKIDSCRLQKM
jgi:hypothetical protein